MRYTKTALLTFGAGLVLGLIVVVVDLGALARVASGLMALGLIGIPIGLAVDWRVASKPAPKPAKGRAKAPVRRRPAVPPRRPPRQRKRVAPKR
jgi:hypothetical protein